MGEGRSHRGRVSGAAAERRTGKLRDKKLRDKKLWDKNEPLEQLIERFTVGDDFRLDAALVAADCAASLAHATMLAGIGVLSAAELGELRAALLEALALAERNRFTIAPADEDGHTALEKFLTARTAAGGKIHTGRSRNDQVMAALRLYGREALVELQRALLDLAATLLAFARRHQQVAMPGRTHSQVAMPSSLGLWAAAFAEELLDDLALIAPCYRLTNRSPLGSAAGYGVPLPLDREQVAALLGFDAPIHNVLAAGNSRGKLEAATLDALDQAALTLSRLAQDLILFSLPELGYVALPVELCTGSSIMPHKRNPDGLELVRARAATVSGHAAAVKGIVRNLPSGYHRDLQETKRPYLEALEIVLGQARVMRLTIERLQVNEAAVARALTPELFTTDAAFALVRQGTAFRDAYRQTATALQQAAGGGAAGYAPGTGIAAAGATAGTDAGTGPAAGHAPGAGTAATGATAGATAGTDAATEEGLAQTGDDPPGAALARAAATAAAQAAGVQFAAAHSSAAPVGAGHVGGALQPRHDDALAERPVRTAQAGPGNAHPRAVGDEADGEHGRGQGPVPGAAHAHRGRSGGCSQGVVMPLAGLERQQGQRRQQRHWKHGPDDLRRPAAHEAAARRGSYAHAQRGDHDGRLDNGQCPDDEPKSLDVHDGKPSGPVPVVAVDVRKLAEKALPPCRSRRLLDQASFWIERGPREPEVIGVDHRRQLYAL